MIELNRDIVLKKVLRYCAYQDRCTQEVRNKLATFDIPDSDKKKIMQLLVDEGYLDDERYASTFVRSKIHLPGFHPWVGKILWRGEWQPSPVFLPGESYGQRSLESCSQYANRVRHKSWTRRSD